MSRKLKKNVGLRKAPPVGSGATTLPAVETPEGVNSLGSRLTGGSERRAVLGVCIFLAAAIWLVFGQTLGFGFVNYDDPTYVYENPIVQKGLTWEGFGWAFTHVYASNWHPLTWLSHMLDCQLYGLHAGGHHLTNVLLHTATAILLFLVLRQMTGCLWRSAFVAAVFAVHPLRAESVAWIAERKDVLSGLFFMLTLAAYFRYVRRPWSPVRYGLVVFLFAMGLMCKPMLVTLPFVLLLLDYWPLNRWRVDPENEAIFRPGDWRIPKRPILEKLPFLGLTVASCAITIFAQTRAVRSFENLPLSLRLENALVSYVAYIAQMFWPSGLAIPYSLTTKGVSVGSVMLSLVVLGCISTGVFVLRRRWPYFLTGWLWYLIMLVPVIGLVQVGVQARADRYTYLPQIGLYVLLTWAAVDFTARWRHRQWVLAGLSAIILSALICCARTQTAYWRNSEALWTHTLACTSENFVAHNDLGNALLHQGKVDEAIAQYQRALQLNPGSAGAHNNLGTALLEQGKVDEAVVQYQQALQINPRFVEAYNNLGDVLLQKGSVDRAIAFYQAALQIKPHLAKTYCKLGSALLRKGSVDKAITYFQEAVQIEPDSVEACSGLGDALRQNGNTDKAIAWYQKALQIKPRLERVCYILGNAFREKGSMDEAIAYYQKALQIKPDYMEAQNNLAWVLATCPQASLRNANRAVELAQRANRLAGNENPIVLGTLAAAYAETGQFPQAVKTAQRALQLARTQSNSALADAIQSQLKFYQAGRPFRSH